MALRIDLNADMGESFGPWKMGNDAALLDIVTSANIACGFHAGDPNVMARTMELATRKGVGIGAHPGFSDLQGFGRRRLALSTEELRNMITYQLGAARAMAHSVGGQVRHFKLHGALSNMASESLDMARTCFAAALAVHPDLILMGSAGTAHEAAAHELKANWAGEIFADRAYNDDATLVDRSLPGAVVHDPDAAAVRIRDMLKAGAIIAQSGKLIPCAIDTICLHGDGETALALARGLRTRLEDAGYRLAAFDARPA